MWKAGDTKTPIGLITEPVFQKICNTPTAVIGDIDVDHEAHTIALFQLQTEAERSANAAAVSTHWRQNSTFHVLSGWRDELYPVHGPGDELLYSIERTAAALFGFVTYGVHMTAYTKAHEVSHGIKIWVPRRSREKQTYAGMLDNTVAGGMATGEVPLECLVRECEEEASLEKNFVRENAISHGFTTYLYLRDEQATGEVGLVQPECEYIFDLELPIDMKPRPNDSEVEEFYLLTVEEVQKHMTNGEFKPNCALVMLDFFIRRGILTSENEKDYEEIKRRIHRVLEFPGPHRI